LYCQESPVSPSDMIIADYMEVVTNQLLLFCLQISQFCNCCCSISVIFIEFEIQKELSAYIY